MRELRESPDAGLEAGGDVIAGPGPGGSPAGEAVGAEPVGPEPVGAEPAPGEFELTAVLHALSDPMRLEMVRQLDAGGVERTCGSFVLPIAKSTATHHWRVLREAGVVSARSEGTRKFHRLRRAELDQRFPGLLDSIVANAPVG